MLVFINSYIVNSYRINCSIVLLLRPGLVCYFDDNVIFFFLPHKNLISTFRLHVGLDW